MGTGCGGASYPTLRILCDHSVLSVTSWSVSNSLLPSQPRQSAHRASRHYGCRWARRDWSRRASCIACAPSPPEIGTPFPCASSRGIAGFSLAAIVASKWIHATCITGCQHSTDRFPHFHFCYGKREVRISEVILFSYRKLFAFWALITSGLAIGSTAGHAQDYSPFSAERAGSPRYRQCIASYSYPSNVDRGNCLAAEAERQDALLRLAFNELVSSAPISDRAQLRRAQQAWETFRTENCEVRTLGGGSRAGLFYLSCLIRETIARRREIENL